MPPEGEGERLTAAQLATVRRWIEEGATGPDEPPPPDPREHWAFKPPVRPPLPAGRAPNPIDRPWVEVYPKLGPTATITSTAQNIMKMVNRAMANLRSSGLLLGFLSR